MSVLAVTHNTWQGTTFLQEAITTKRVLNIDDNTKLKANLEYVKSNVGGGLHSYREITTIGTTIVTLPEGVTNAFVTLSGGGGAGRFNFAPTGLESFNSTSDAGEDTTLSSASNVLLRSGGGGGFRTRFLGNNQYAFDQRTGESKTGASGGTIFYGYRETVLSGTGGKQYFLFGKGGSSEEESKVINANKFPLTFSIGAGGKGKLINDGTFNVAKGGNGYAKIWFYK